MAAEKNPAVKQEKPDKEETRKTPKVKDLPPTKNPSGGKRHPGYPE